VRVPCMPLLAAGRVVLFRECECVRVCASASACECLRVCAVCGCVRVRASVRACVAAAN
jgi:hypothetical protein